MAKKYIYEFPMAAVTATMSIVDPKTKQILLAKRSDNSDAFPSMWSLPGGFLDVGTETVRQCASREIMEECNLVVDPNDWTILGIDDKPGYDPRYTQVVNICYGLSVRDVLNDINNMAPNDDVQELKWVSFEDAKNMELAFNHNAIIEMAINAMGD